MLEISRLEEQLAQMFGELVHIVIDEKEQERLGYYSPKKRVIVLCTHLHENVEETVHVLLHEYKHAMQHIEEENCFVGYNEQCRLIGYENHPLEVEAEQFAFAFEQMFLKKI